TPLHGTHGAHATVTLVLLAVDGDGVTGGLCGAGEHGAEHDGAGTGGECLGDVTGELHATVGDDGDTGLAGGHGGFHDGGDLRCTDTGDHAGGADGARADTDLDGVRAGFDHGLGGLTGGEVATDDLHAGEVLLHAGNHLQHATGVGVGGVDDEDVHTGIHEGAGTLVGLVTGTDARGDEQTSGGILGGVRVLLGLDEVLDGDQTDKLVVLVHDGQLLHLVGGQQLQCVLLGHALLGHDQRHRGHDIGDQAVGVRLETHVAVGAQTQQGAVLVHH